VTDEEAELRAESARIEVLLADIRELVPLPAWQRVEDILRRIVRLYAAGLARSLRHARAQGVDRARFDEEVCRDELLASLLVLHGLHPQTTEQRLAAALERVRAELGVSQHALVLAGVRDGVAKLVASEALDPGAMASSLATSLIERVLLIAAPEIDAVEISGLPAGRDPSLVQLRTSREAR
jgi:hypothetical protein